MRATRVRTTAARLLVSLWIATAALGAVPARAAESGYWVLTESALKDTGNADGEYWKSTVSAAANSAVFTTRGAQNEYEKTSTSWTNPPERIYPGTAFELQFSAKVDALTNRASSPVSVQAYWDAPGLDPGYTMHPVYLANASGGTACETATESASMTVSGSLDAQAIAGDKITLYVQSYNNGMLVQARYVYAWVLGKEKGGLSGTIITSVSGFVEVATHEEEQLGRWRLAKPGMKLEVGEHVRTGEESVCILSFADLSIFVMAPETHIVTAPPPDKDSKLPLVWGKIKANIKKMMKDGSMEIDMSQAAMSIKGTTFVCEDDGKTSTLKVFEGTVEFTAKATGKGVTVEAGQQASASAAGLSDVTAFDTAAEQEAWASLEATLGADSGAGQPSGDSGGHEPGGNQKILTFVLICVGAGTLLMAGLAVLLVRSKKKKRVSAAQQGWESLAQGAFPPGSFCAGCGGPTSTGAKFCARCGRLQ